MRRRAAASGPPRTVPARTLWIVALGLVGTALADGRAAPDADRPSFHVAPAVDTVPTNHLKFYLHFPEPMERGGIFRHLRLLRLDGEGKKPKEVEEPFREVELWDDSFTRLTLWFHPGRQKPGVNLNLEFGPVLEEGGRYHLEVDGAWRTAAGEPLGEDRVHEFAAGPPDEKRPDPERWTIRAIDPSTVKVTAGEPLDPVSLRKRLTVRDEAGEVVEARTTVFGEGFRLRRDSGWEAGEYRMVVEPQLEDLAGNSVSRPFNVDVQADSGIDLQAEPVEVDFRIEEDP